MKNKFIKQIKIRLTFIFIFKIFLIGTINIFLLNCSTDLDYAESQPLAPPSNISVDAISNCKFNFHYYIQNQENNFDGYNLYISKTNISDNPSIDPITLNGSLPTFQHNYTQYSETDIQSVELEFFQNNSIRFEEDTYYYFRLSAHSITGKQSLPSEEIMSKTIN